MPDSLIRTSTSASLPTVSYTHLLGRDYRIAGGAKYTILEDNIGYIYYGDFSSGIGNGNLDEILLYLSLIHIWNHRSRMGRNHRRDMDAPRMRNERPGLVRLSV